MGSSGDIINVLYNCFNLMISPLKYSLDVGTLGNSIFWLSATIIAFGVVSLIIRFIKRVFNA